MCEANAYWTREGGEELIMEAVDTIEPEGDGIFSDQKRIRGRIKSMQLVDHKILFEVPAD